MTVSVPVVRRLTFLVAMTLVAAALTSCAHSPKRMPTAGERDADKYLFDRGTEALARKHWLEAREYFRRLVDTYPQSPYRQEAKLGVGDSFLGEGRVESHILAAAEFRDFLQYYPLNERADYAQFRLAISQVRQMLGPERDQTATRDALRELDIFVRSYPNSKLMPDVLKVQRETRDRLSDSEFIVGKFHFRSRNYPGAVQRLKYVMESDPGFSRRDGVYFFLAEAYGKMKQPALAKPLYEKVVDEFPTSAYVKDAKKRLDVLKVAAATTKTVTH